MSSFTDVGFKIGGSTSIQYLTLQIHYSHALEGIFNGLFLLGRSDPALIPPTNKVCYSLTVFNLSFILHFSQ